LDTFVLRFPLRTAIASETHVFISTQPDSSDKRTTMDRQLFRSTDKVNCTEMMLRSSAAMGKNPAANQDNLAPEESDRISFEV
jgi:hypothetical protein